MKTKQRDLIKKMKEDPVSFYKDWKSRLELEGGNASFQEELSPVILYLEMKLNSDEMLRTLCTESQHLAKFRMNVLQRLRAVQEPHDGDPAYPYMKSLEAIERSLEFLDIAQRVNNPSLPPLYHSLRYQYYLHFLAGSVPEHIMMPTLHPLGATDFIALRGVPVGLLGVITDVTYVDGFRQSSFEFYIHDVNHSRRMYQFLKEAAEARGVDLGVFSEESSEFVKTRLLPLITVLKEDSEEVIARKKIIKMILFEICHEDAQPATMSAIQKALSRDTHCLTPFEGIEHNKCVRYFMEEGATTLSYVYRKLVHAFYDPPDAPLNIIVPVKKRTRESIYQAAWQLNDSLGCGVNEKLLEALGRSDRNFPGNFLQQIMENIQNHPGVSPIGELLESSYTEII